jgi:outer membrane lipoprotein-sorting protein
LIKKLNFIFSFFFFYLIIINISEANFEKKLLNKYKSINTLSFEFTQKIGDKVEFGNCLIKYPLLMKCDYPKKKKNIISNGKKLVIVKRRYKKIYYYSLKKTPLFQLLDKKNILNLIKDSKPILIDSNVIGYELINANKSKINIFFDKKSLDISGWKTTDSYSNEVNFLIRNIEKNIPIENKIFNIPREEDL